MRQDERVAGVQVSPPLFSGSRASRVAPSVDHSPDSITASSSLRWTASTGAMPSEPSTGHHPRGSRHQRAGCGGQPHRGEGVPELEGARASHRDDARHHRFWSSRPALHNVNTPFLACLPRHVDSLPFGPYLYAVQRHDLVRVLLADSDPFGLGTLLMQRALSTTSGLLHPESGRPHSVLLVLTAPCGAA